MRGGLAALALLAGLGFAHAAACTHETNAAALTEARELVRSLYDAPDLVDARSDIDAATIDAAKHYVTERLFAALQVFSDALSEADESADPLTKSPYPTGPLFYSNYEGMNAFSVGDASAGPDHSIHVNVEMSFSSVFGAASWTDIAVLRCEGDAWKLDNVVYDPSQTAGPSLTERIAVR